MPGLWRQGLVGSQAAYALVLAFALFLLTALFQGVKPFYYDSGHYWYLGTTFVQEGSFSLFNFNADLRGYALPLVYHFADGVGSALTVSSPRMVMAFNAAAFSLVGAVLAPRFAQIAWPEIEWSIPRRLALCALLVLFWRGYLSYPLSDVPALAAALVALTAISSPESPRAMFVAGFAAALAVNMRPAYILIFPVLAVLVAIEWVGRRGNPHGSIYRRSMCVALLLAGVLLVSVPQALVRHQQFGSYHPVPGGGDLVNLQYSFGLAFQRYETFVGGSPEQARMVYLDPYTADMAGVDGGVDGTGDYLRIVIENPVTMTGVFLRHLVNGLDQRYPTPYVERLEGGWNRLWRLLGFLLVFFALVRVCWPAARRSLKPARWRYPAALSALCLTALPSAVETRFMLPVFVACCLLLLAPGWPDPRSARAHGLRRYSVPAVLAVSCVLFLLSVWVVVSGATDNLSLGGA